MYYTGIDQHKHTSYLTTVDNQGVIIKQANLKNNNHDILNYFHQFGDQNIATVETTGGWYWMSDLLEANNIDQKLAHAKYVKAIAYAKVKTDKVDSQILAQLLRMDFIPEANKIDEDFSSEQQKEGVNFPDSLPTISIVGLEIESFELLQPLLCNHNLLIRQNILHCVDRIYFAVPIPPVFY